MTPLRLRAAWRLVLAFAALVALGAGLAVMQARERSRARLAEALARLDAADPKWRVGDVLARHNARVPPPESNATDAAVAALALDAGGFKRWAARGRGPAPPSNRRMDPADAGFAEESHAGCLAAVLAARKVVDFPEGGSVLVPNGPDPSMILLPRLQPVREAANLLELDALVRAHRGDAAGALDSLAAIVHLGAAAIGDEPCVMSQLVRDAVTGVALTSLERTLAWTVPPEARLAGLQEALRRERGAPRLRVGYRGDRAITIGGYEAIGSGAVVPVPADADAGTRPVANPVDRVRSWSWRAEMTETQSFTLAEFDALLVAAELPDPERAEAVAASLAVPTPNRLAASHRAWWAKFSDAETCLRARLACAEVALACERFRLRTGHFPASLDELPAGLLAGLPADPYTGGPLGYRVTPEGVAVSSAGPESTNGGGGGTALGFRLWNPALRGLPAGLPEPPPD